jgi:hypothetical protein
MPMRHVRLFIAVLICSVACAPAQNASQVASQDAAERKTPDTSEKPAPAATVTGHVFLDDTKSPARKAEVYLEPVASLQADAPPPEWRSMNRGPVTVKVEAQFDGSYIFTHVPPGSYYIVATSSGYVSPLVALRLAEARSQWDQRGPLGPQQKEAREKILQSLSRVDVQPNQPSTADVVLERGAAISGNVTYDDGVPAAGLRVEVLSRMLQDGKETWAPLNLGYQPLPWILTDDRGSFRVSGLPAGKYAIEVTLEFTGAKMYLSSSSSTGFTSNAQAASLPIYSGNTPRVKDAAGFTLQAREERTGEDIVIPLSKLHTIKGNIVSATDGHIVNYGVVRLDHADDHSTAGYGSLTEDDMSFRFSFIFEGDYILSNLASYDVEYLPVPRPEGNIGPPQFNTRIGHPYGAASIFLHVDRDMDGVTLAVPEPTGKEAQMYKEMMQQQENQQNQTPAQQ